MGEFYDDKGLLGSPGFKDQDEPFKPARETRFEGGYGATEADLKRGYVEPVIRDKPNYDLSNYKDRCSVPSEPDLGPGNHMALSEDWEFRQEGLRSKGFLTRPRIPIERN